MLTLTSFASVGKASVGLSSALQVAPSGACCMLMGAERKVVIEKRVRVMHTQRRKGPESIVTRKQNGVVDLEVGKYRSGCCFLVTVLSADGIY